jgi:hypothetical protein
MTQKENLQKLLKFESELSESKIIKKIALYKEEQSSAFD